MYAHVRTCIIIQYGTSCLYVICRKTTRVELISIIFDVSFQFPERNIDSSSCQRLSRNDFSYFCQTYTNKQFPPPPGFTIVYVILFICIRNTHGFIFHRSLACTITITPMTRVLYWVVSVPQVVDKHRIPVEFSTTSWDFIDRSSFTSETENPLVSVSVVYNKSRSGTAKTFNTGRHFQT